jgi:hypothetical protein
MSRKTLIKLGLVLLLAALGAGISLADEGILIEQNGDYPRNEGDCRIYGPASYCCWLANGQCGCTPSAGGMGGCP